MAGAGAGPVVGQNEYFRWRGPGQIGAHSRAYAVLLEPQSQRIAANLGIGPAHEADECLACHSDNVPPAMRGDRFQISDGVGCEACHGGAENWLASHRIGPPHAENIANGLYPTEDPTARAELCISCHLGSSVENQFVTHRIMGAGHPRMKFELDLYTTIQKHHTVDEDYRARKEVAESAQVWAIGQAVTLARMLDLFVNENVGMSGAFPELVFFDCHACHQPISNDISQLSWRPNPARPVGPGSPTFNDAHLIMLTAAARALDTQAAETLEAQGRRFHAALLESRDDAMAAARALAATARDLAAQFDRTSFEDADARAMLGQVLAASLSARYTNYAAAEQALFAVQRLTADITGEDPPRELSDAVNRASQHVASPYAYNQSGFRRALNEIASMIGGG
ncbi:MAG: hypothetical protein Tsb0010_05010 [Parvularculaceae bacterium]